MRVLAGDIGGTNSRLIIAEVDGPRCRTLIERRLPSRDHASFASVLESFLSATRGDRSPAVSRACFAIAGPILDDDGTQRVRLTNLPWAMDSAALASEFDFERVRFINDFQAVGYGIGALAPQDLVTLQAGSPRALGPRVVLGAGTGLGQTVCVWQGDYYEALPTEGGHVDFAPTDELQDELLRYLRKQHERISCERILSGSGLVHLYAFLHSRAAGGSTAAPALHSPDPAAAVSGAALDGSDPLAVQALDLFVTIYGAHAGDLGLTVLASGGVYVAGGIAPKIIGKLQDGTFVRAFNAKGRMADLVQSMPVHVVMNESVGLLGAALTAARV